MVFLSWYSSPFVPPFFISSLTSDFLSLYCGFGGPTPLFVYQKQIQLFGSPSAVTYLEDEIRILTDCLYCPPLFRLEFLPGPQHGIFYSFFFLFWSRTVLQNVFSSLPKLGFHSWALPFSKMRAIPRAFYNAYPRIFPPGGPSGEFLYALRPRRRFPFPRPLANSVHFVFLCGGDT